MRAKIRQKKESDKLFKKECFSHFRHLSGAYAHNILGH